jgi:thymidylate synthase (FAD)
VILLMFLQTTLVMINMQSVKLISMTQPVTECDFKTAQDLLSYVTRVSNPENQKNFETAEKLIRYCLRKKHWSPFTMIDLTFEIETTRDIGRQILRHKSFDFQEFSQRYADPTQLGTTTREARMQDLKNRQNSIEVTNDGSGLIDEWNEIQTELIQNSIDAYNWAIGRGIAKEQARAVLPEGLTMSRMYMKGSLRSWITYCDVRRGPETQKEHRQIADAIWEVLKEQFKFLEEYNNAV